MPTIAAKVKLHKISFQQQGYLGLELNISRVLSLWDRSRSMNGHPSLFPFNSLPHLARPFGLQDKKYLTESPTSLPQKMPSGSLLYFQICLMT